MKSQVSFLLQQLEKEGKKLTEQDIADIAYEFQEATVEILAKRLIKAGKEHDVATLAVAGGVSANARLIEYLTHYAEGRNEEDASFPHLQKPVGFLYPKKKVYSTDN